MKTWKKVLIGVVVAGLLIGIVVFSVNQANKGVVTVQTAKVATSDDLVSLVTASGEIKPTTYTNVTAQGFGRITEILVKRAIILRRAIAYCYRKTCRQARTCRRSPPQSIPRNPGCRRQMQVSTQRKQTWYLSRRIWKRPNWIGSGGKVCTRMG